MSTAGELDLTPVADARDLAAWIESGCKPKARWRIGTEHEKFGVVRATRRPLPYEAEGSASVTAMLQGLERFGWSPVLEGGRPIGLKREDASVSLEPGGQFELSGAPLEDVHQTCAELGVHLREVREVADEIGADFLGLGMAPEWSLDDMPRVPKARYVIMREYMPRVGRLGREMMFRTCTVQANFDFASEADMVDKLRAAIALQPLVTALFANSPFTDGRPNGWLSYRAHVWADTDPDRTGMLPQAFAPGFGFEAYVDYALDTPMYFLRRDGRFIDVAGAPFRLFLNGRLPGFEGQRPSLGDWEDHISTLFPEARVKRYIETRGADAGPRSRLCALPAFWTGLLYDETALAAALDLVKGWTAEDREALRLVAPKLGLRSPIAGRRLGEVALDALAIADAGLKARAKLNGAGDDERVFLADLHDIARSGLTPAERLLEQFNGAWGRSIAPIYEFAAF